MIRKIMTELEIHQHTKKEFQELIVELIKWNKCVVFYTLTDDLNNQFEFGYKSDGEADKIETTQFNNGYKLKTEIWTQGGSGTLDDYVNIFKLFWNSKFCDKTTGFPTTENQLFLDKCNETLKNYRNQSQKVALVMIDLDNFREVNNKNDHETGSKVLGQFASIIYSVIGDRGIVIHQTGDEFNIIIPYENLEDVIELLNETRDKVNSFKFFASDDIELSMAIGIKCIDDSTTDYTDARNAAEKIYSNSNKKNAVKQRDSIRIDGNTHSSYGEIDLKLAWTRLIANLDNQILGNVFLEYIRKYSLKVASINEFKENIEKIIDWINPEWDSNIRCTSTHILVDTKASFSSIELFLAIMQGLLKNENFASSQFVLSCKNNNLGIYMDNNVIFQKDSEINLETFDCKCLNEYRKEDGMKCKRAILIQAGYDDIDIPRDLFYSIIHVDIRPTLGGGLPDFWVATLSELMMNTKENPNISEIYIYGKTQYTENIIKILDCISEWDKAKKYNNKYISKKTFKSIEDVILFQKKFRNKIHKCSDKKELVNKIYTLYKNSLETSEDRNIDISKNNRFLERNLSYDDVKLKISDGCRVDTIAEVYPIVLEILRKQAYNDFNSIKDQAGRELLELRDFKIILLKPNSKIIPEYYCGDEELLDDYYQKVLGSNDALFKKEMIKDSQLDALFSHIIQTITSQNNYATRRAILIVEKEHKTGEDYSPLGLISVWLAPRFDNENVVVDFSYNWRTVESIVGLPLSLYASVRFAEEIVEQIKDSIPNSKYKVRLGKVSYIAHSLHMFLDTESMEVVRGIVNDASI